MNESESVKTYAIFDTAANRKIVGNLEKSGANVRLFPPIETTRIELNETEAVYFTALEKFDWLIFTDVFAVDYFLEILAENTVDFYDLDDLRVCAFGEAVSDRLRFASLHADVIPAKVKTAEVFAALLNYIGETEISGLRFLYLSAEAAKNNLPEKLRTNSAEVIEVPLYRAIVNDSSELIKLKTLLKGGAIDEFILTAPTDLIALKNYFESENLSEITAEIVISATDGVMLQAAKEDDFSRVGLFKTGKVDKVS